MASPTRPRACRTRRRWKRGPSWKGNSRGAPRSRWHKSIFNSLKRGWSQLQPRGELHFTVTVGPDGNAIDVHDFGGVRGVNAAEMSSYVTTVLMTTKYKPGLCKGEPCTMQFPFRLKL